VITTVEVPEGYRATLRAVSRTDEPVLSALDRAWARLRNEDTAIPDDLVFDLQPGRSSSCGQIEFDTLPVMILNLAPSWDGEKESLAEHKLTGAQIAQLLLHHAAHALAGPTTSQEGRWHSEAYRDAAQRLGLAVERGGNGWNKTSLARGSVTRYRPEIAALDRAMAQWEPVVARKRKRGAVSLRCSCTPPRVLSASGGTAAVGRITCGYCGGEFVVGS
jgi:hypothetical protein